MVSSAVYVSFVLCDWDSREDSRNRWDIEDAVAKSAEGDGGVADVGEVGEHHLQDGDVRDDWGGDGGDEEEDSGAEQEEGADMVEHASAVLRHFAGMFSKSREWLLLLVRMKMR